MSSKSYDPSSAGKSSKWTRRSFLKGVGVAAVASEAVLQRAADAAEAPLAPDALNTVLEGPLKLTLNINEQQRQVTVEPRTTLLSALRDYLDPPITGPKLVCNEATCGPC